MQDFRLFYNQVFFRIHIGKTTLKKVLSGHPMTLYANEAFYLAFHSNC